MTHGGSRPVVRANAERRLAERDARELIERTASRLGGRVDTDPLDAVQEAAWNVSAYRLVIEGYGVHIAPDGAVATTTYNDGNESSASTDVHILVKLYNEERDRLVKYAKICLDAGVEERRVRVREAEGLMLARVVQAAIDACEPTPAARHAAFKAAGVVMRELDKGETT
jgi:hypothetical protein